MGEDSSDLAPYHPYSPRVIDHVIAILVNTHYLEALVKATCPLGESVCWPKLQNGGTACQPHQ